MQGDMHKVNAGHLKRNAYLYVRQSTPRQVLENTESTKRQYALRQRAIALGWHADRIVVIDSDLGQSGSSATDRKGFQRLVGEVGMGHAGLVIGLEVSRLARNSSDWHRLLVAVLPPPGFRLCRRESLSRREAAVSPQAQRWAAGWRVAMGETGPHPNAVRVA